MSMLGLGLERRRGGALALSGALLAASSFETAVAGAEEPDASGSYRLHWVREGGAESCASGAALSRMLEQVLGQRPPSGQALLLEGSARAAAPPLRFSVQVTVKDAATREIVGERELTTAEPQCSALTPALLLVLAMSVDPNAGREGLPQAVTDELQRSHEEDVDVWPVAPAQPVATAAPRAKTTASAPETKREAPPPKAASGPEPLPIFGAVAASTAILPSVAVGGALGAELPLRRGWLLSLAMFAWTPQTVRLPESVFLEDGGVEIAAGQLGVALCRALFGDTVQLGACGGLGAGLRWVKAQALANEDNPTRAFFGPELQLEASYRPRQDSVGGRPPWFVAASAAGQAQLRKDRFTYQNHLGQMVPWFEPSWFSSRFWLSIGVTL